MEASVNYFRSSESDERLEMTKRAGQTDRQRERERERERGHGDGCI